MQPHLGPSKRSSGASSAGNFHAGKSVRDGLMTDDPPDGHPGMCPDGASEADPRWRN